MRLISSLVIALAVGCGAVEGKLATQSEIDGCRAVCLQFGPEGCTRRCYALCDGGCAHEIAGKVVHGIQCLGDVVNFHSEGGTLACSDGTSASFDGSLPSGAWNSGKRIFVTSQSFAGGEIKQAGGMTSGIASADRICQNLAVAAGLSGPFKAWLSDSTTDAITRIAEAGPWYNVDRIEILFRSKADLLAAPLAWFMFVEDERGQPVQSSGYLGIPDVWTGTGQTGLHKAPSLGNMTNCADWTASQYTPISTPSDLYGNSGSVTSAEKWTEDGAVNRCSYKGRLYCFEQ